MRVGVGKSMDGGSLPLYLALVAFILFSGYFAASETAFATAEPMLPAPIKPMFIIFTSCK